jgi:argininosuccinate lyase
MDIEKGAYQPARQLKHTHEGSIGNLMLPEIKKSMENVLSGFQFEKVQTALTTLTSR